MELIRERGAFYALRFTNHGTQAAYHVRIELESSFLDSIEEENAKELLQKQQGREMIIGVSEHYDLFFGSRLIVKTPKNNRSPEKQFMKTETILRRAL